MSFEIQGTIVTPDYRAKEKVLRTVIASRDAEIAALRAEWAKGQRQIDELIAGVAIAREEFRALKAKERRRAVKRKKANEAG